MDLSAGNAVASMPCSRGEGEVSKEMDAEKAREMATCVTWWLETKLNDAGRGHVRARTARACQCHPAADVPASRVRWPGRAKTNAPNHHSV